MWLNIALAVLLATQLTSSSHLQRNAVGLLEPVMWLNIALAVVLAAQLTFSSKPNQPVTLGLQNQKHCLQSCSWSL